MALRSLLPLLTVVVGAHSSCEARPVHFVAQGDSGALHARAMYMEWDGLVDTEADRVGTLQLRCTGSMVEEVPTSLRWVGPESGLATHVAPSDLRDVVAEWIAPSRREPGRMSLILGLDVWAESAEGAVLSLTPTCKIPRIATSYSPDDCLWRWRGGGGAEVECPFTSSSNVSSASSASSLHHIQSAGHALSLCTTPVSSGASAFLESRGGVLRRTRPASIEHDEGMCGGEDGVAEDEAFVETAARLQGAIPGLDKMMSPIMEGLLQPVTKLVGGVLGDALGSSLKQTLGQSVDAGLTSEVTAQLTDSLTSSLAAQLVPPLSGSLADTVADATTSLLEQEVASKLAPELADSLARSLPEAIVPQLVDELREDISLALSQSLTRTLIHLGTRSVTEATVPALAMGLAHSPAESYYCALCKETGQYCKFCPKGEGHPPATLAHAHYFAAYYSAYYAAGIESTGTVTTAEDGQGA